MKLRTKLPIRLAKEPVLEAIWQIRFQSEQQLASEVLTGILFQKWRPEFKKTERLFGSSLPKEFRDRQPGLQYLPSVRLDGTRFSVGIGERVVSLNAKLPYCGWKTFSAKIRELVPILEGSGFIEKIENFSIKYIDCIVEPVPASLSASAIRVTIADRDFKAEPILLRTEFTELGLKHVVQIALPAQVALPDTTEKKTGVVTEVETFCDAPTKGNGIHTWVDERLDEVHNANKAIFFSLLTDETVRLLEPIYDKESN
jgi:uncharacterized protein (TIGR04255 family)